MSARFYCYPYISVKGAPYLHICTFAKRPVTGDSNLHKLWCIRAREEAGSKCAGVGNCKLLSRKSLQLRKNFVLLPRIVKAMPWIVPWCNGSTRVFGSLSPRSNRSGTTSPSPRALRFFVFSPTQGSFRILTATF